MTIQKTATQKKRWLDDVYGAATKKHPERKGRFSTLSDEVIEPLYSSEDLEGFDEDRDLGCPGARHSAGSARRDDPERRAQGIHRATRVDRSGEARDEARCGHLQIRLARRAALEHDLDLRLPHP